MAPQVSSATSSTDFQAIFRAALEGYKHQTKKDIASHPLAIQMQSCNSPSAILAVLRVQVQAFDESKSSDEKLTKWLDPTVNVLYAFSAILGNGVGMIFPPSNAIFVGIGVLLQTIKDVRASQSALVDLFGRIEYFFKRLETYIEIQPTAAMTDIIVKIMVEVLLILGIVTKEIGQGRMKKYLKQLVGRKDVDDALQRLDKLTQEEARMAAAEVLKISHNIDNKVKDVDVKVESIDERVQGVDMKVEGINDKVQGVDHKIGSAILGVKENGVAIQQVVNQVSDLNRNDLRKDLRKWIAPSDPSVNFNAASGAHHEGTATWCIKGNTLADWKTSGSLLWIHGKPGSGKSILSSVIVRDIKSLSNAGSAFLAYFYFDFKDTTKQDSRALLSSLLVQLSDQSDIFCDTLSSLYSTHGRGSEQPTDESLVKCLKDMLTSAGQVPIYLIMDALDECPNDSGIPSSREKVLELMKELVELHHPNLRLCITSRPEFDIRITFGSLATQQISLHDECGQKQDINDYVTFVVHSDRRMKRWRDDDKRTVIEKLAEKADGMFRWVFCQLGVLRHCFPTNLRRILEELPKSLDETYKRILKEINNANGEHAYRLLQCLAVASRPLRVEELAEVLAFDLSTGGIPTLIADWRWEDQEEAVLSACSSLVSVVIDNGSQVVQFSHFSVKEYLTSDRLASCMEEVSQFHIPIEPSHMILAQACLCALLRLDDRIDNDSANKTPLLQYAAEYGFGHAIVGNVELQIKDAMDSFADMNKSHFSAWVQIVHAEDFFTVPDAQGFFPFPWHEQPLSSGASLHFAALMGFRGLVERLVLKHPQHVNQWGGKDGTPLHASVLGGHIKVAQLLLAHGADINSRSANHWTPLHITSQRGDVEAGKWLLNCGADMNTRTKNGQTPLHFAAFDGHLEVCRILLEHNAKVHAQDDEGSTPLHHAIRQQSPSEIVQLLLYHNADVHVRDNKGHTPLHLAASNGHHDVTRILLERNAEVNALDGEGSTPLHHATCAWPEVVQLLLDHSANAHVRNNKRHTPLHLAATEGQLEVTRILLERNVDSEVNAQDDAGLTPLHRATRGSQSGSHTEVVRLLLDHNADTEVRDNKGHTPLHLAVTKGRLDIARILLERNAEVNAQDDEGSSPLHQATRDRWRGHPRIVRLLLDHNANMDVRDNKRRTPLHLAATNGRLEDARILLERNAEVNAQDDEGWAPLHHATQAWPKVVQLLLDHNANAHVRNNKGHTPLHLAATKSRLDVARILLERNAEANAQDDEGSTPLHHAIQSPRGELLEVVQLLLGHHADVHIRDNKGHSPLHLAATEGRLDAARMLLERNAEVNTRDEKGFTPLHQATHIRDNKGHTPLHFAATKSHLDVARILLEQNAEVNAQDDEGSTPLHHATLSWSGESPEVVRLLLDYDADVHVRNNKGHTPLHSAVTNGRLKVARILLEHNAEVNTRDDDGFTPFLNASENGNPDIVQLLLDYNATTHVRNNKGHTPLHLAATKNCLDVVRILLERNTEVNAQDNEGLTPLHHATRDWQRASPEVLWSLLDHNADVRVRDNKGHTPLHLVATGGRLDVARILLERNAEVNAQDDEGLTPLHHAARRWWGEPLEVVRLLLEYGADVHAQNTRGETASEVAWGKQQQEVVQLLSRHAAR